jgi:hypothetical protein
LVRALGDFGLIMSLIWLIALGAKVHPGKTFLILSLTVATLATLDLAFLHHLRRAYASPRRGVWRRD